MPDVSRLKETAKQLRLDVLDMIYKAQTGHIGGSLSAADMVAALYFYKMKHDPGNPIWEDRDRFVLSKGHAAPVLYSALARSGYFELSELDRLRQVDSHLQGAPNPKTPGVDMSAGPLGQGLSAAVGMALAAKATNRNYNVYCMIGDGEMQEGQIWEAAMTAAKYKLKNLILILDRNKVQMSGTNNEMMPIGDPGEKFESFGFHIIRIDGHCMEQVTAALDEATEINCEKPVAIISETVKSKGVSFMEGLAEWHGKAPNKEQYEIARAELERGLE